MKPGRLRFIFLAAAAAALLSAPHALAYTDEIYALPEEVWAAAQKTFGPIGVSDEDRKNNEITSHWIYDEVKRKKGLLGIVAKKRFERRYRMTYKFEERENRVLVTARGRFEDRSAGSGPMIPWKNVSPDSEDYQLEREFFMKLLRALSEIKQEKEAAAVPPAV